MSAQEPEDLADARRTLAAMTPEGLGQMETLLRDRAAALRARAVNLEELADRAAALASQVTPP